MSRPTARDGVIEKANGGARLGTANLSLGNKVK
jgi:hypothetical protein